jgi:ABC-type amino acid transport system permease subunit
MRLTPDQFWNYQEWLFNHWGLLWGLGIALILSIVGFLIGFLVATLKHGPSEGFLQVSKVIGELFTIDIPKMSFRRVFA